MQEFKLNAFRTHGEPFAQGLVCQKFIVQADIEASEERQITGRRVLEALRRYYRNLSVFGTIRDEEKVAVYLAAPKPFTPPEFVTYYTKGMETKVPLSYVGEVKLAPTKDRQLIENIMYQAVRERIYQRGYTRVGGTFPKYFGGTPTLILAGEYKEPVNVYDGFKFTLTMFEDGSFLVCIDPSSVERIDLYTYCKLFRARGASEEWLKDWIFKGRPKRKVRVPRGSGIIVNMDFHTKAKGYVYDGENKLDELWEHRGYTIPEDDFVVYVDIDAKPYKAYTYPASVVFLNVQRIVLSADQRKVFTLSPERRIAKTFTFAKELLSEPFRINNVAVRIDTSRLVTTDILQREGKIKEVGILEAPKLRFHNNTLGIEPKELRLKGPYSGEKTLRILYVVPEANIALIKPLHKLLNEAFRSLRLGKLIYSGEVLVRGRPTEESYRAAGKDTATKLAEIEEKEKKIALVLVPRRGQEKHQFIKGMLDRRLNDRRIQFLRLQTARRALDGQEFVLGNLALQLYLKSEERGEAMWILDRPAGGVGNTLYAGFDVTRETKREYDEETKEIISERKEATAEAAVCDSRGLLILMRSLMSSTGEVLTPDTVSELFRSMIQRGEISLSKFDEKPNRVVLFKDGKVFKKTDLPNVRAGYRKVTHEFPGLSFDLISVIKGGIYRIYTLDNRNSPRGTYVLFNDKLTLINASQLTYQKETVTANPKRVEVAFSSQGVDVKQILMEFFDLTALDWASLLVPISTAIPLKLVQNLGEYLREDIYVPEHIDYITL